MSNDNTVLAFGAQFYEGSQGDVLNYIESHRNDGFSYIVTPNVNHIVRLHKDSDFRVAYKRAAMQLCDSRIVRILLRFVGKENGVEVIPGSDLTAEVIKHANLKGWSLAVIGASSQDMERVRASYPNITFYHHNPPMGFISDEAEVSKCIDFIKENPSDVILLAVGSPRQEFLAERIHRSARTTGVALCVGASVLFISGGLKRAPLWIQKLCLEWMFRIVTEPRRLLGRYLSDGFQIVPIFVSELAGKIAENIRRK